MYIGKTPTVGNFQVCDAISVVNGQAAYTLQVGGVNVAPESANHMLVSLNGILQKPGSSFTISGSTMTFASNLATGDVIDFVQILGNVLDIGQPSDDTVTAAKINNDVISGQTALTVSPATTDELLISDAGTLKRIDFSLLGNTPAFMARAGSGQTSISDDTFTKVDVTTERVDTDGKYTSSRFTPTIAGNYFLFGSVVINSETNSNLDVGKAAIYINGSAISGATTEINFAANPPRAATLTTTCIVDLDTDDYVELYAAIEATDASGGSFSTGSSFGGYKLIGH